MKQTREEREEQLRGSLKTILFFLAGLIFCSVLVSRVFQFTWISGDSMNDTLSDAECAVVNKLTYQFSQPERFDIVLFSYTDISTGEEKTLVKRIIGLPGEWVQIKDGAVWIDGEILEDSCAKEPWTFAGCAADGIFLDSDEYFVLGDNRNHSKDSRSVSVYGVPEIGPVHRTQMIGRVELRVLPFRKFGIVE